MEYGYGRHSRLDTPDDTAAQDAVLSSCDRVVIEDEPEDKKSIRPALQEILSEMTTGDTLVVWRLDRLSRSAEQLFTTLMHLRRIGAHLRIADLGIDTADRKMSPILMLVDGYADADARLVRERGAKSKENGKTGGRRRAFSDSDIARIKELLKTQDAKQVADTMHVSISTIYRYIHGGREGVTGIKTAGRNRRYERESA